MKVTELKNTGTKLKTIVKWSNRLDEAEVIRELENIVGKHSIRAQSMKKVKIA